MRDGDAAARLFALLGDAQEPEGLAAASAREWGSLYELAAWHGVLPLLALRLRERSLASRLPPDTRRALDAAYTLGALRAAALQEQLREVVGALAAHGVRVVLLKGALVGEELYGDPSVRPMADVDLLVPGDRLEAARGALGAVGYRPVAGGRADYAVHRHDRPLVRPGRLPIELHRAIEPCIAPGTLAIASVWAGVREVRIAGVPVLALAPDDLLLHLATHMGRSHPLGTRLVAVCDVAAWVRRFGPSTHWATLAARARAAGAGRFVYAALATAARTLAAAVPHEALAGFDPTPSDEAAVATAERLLRQRIVVPGDVTASAPDATPATRLHRVLQAAIPTPAALRRHYGAHESVPELYLRHVRAGHLGRLMRAAGIAASPWRWPAAWARIGALRTVRRWGVGDA